MFFYVYPQFYSFPKCHALIWKRKIGTKFSPGAPTPKRPSLRSDMGIGEPGGGKEREPRDNGEPSLPGGATI